MEYKYKVISNSKINYIGYSLYKSYKYNSKLICNITLRIITKNLKEKKKKKIQRKRRKRFVGKRNRREEKRVIFQII